MKNLRLLVATWASRTILHPTPSLSAFYHLSSETTLRLKPHSRLNPMLIAPWINSEMTSFYLLMFLKMHRSWRKASTRFLTASRLSASTSLTSFKIRINTTLLSSRQHCTAKIRTRAVWVLVRVRASGKDVWMVKPVSECNNNALTVQL